QPRSGGQEPMEPLAVHHRGARPAGLAAAPRERAAGQGRAARGDRTSRRRSPRCLWSARAHGRPLAPPGRTGPLGPFGPLGPLGPVGAHAFEATADGDFVDANGEIKRTVSVEWSLDERRT